MVSSCHLRSYRNMEGKAMSGERILDALNTYRKRYAKADRSGRSSLLDEFCGLTDYHRKYAIALLGKPADSPPPNSTPRRRGPTYSPASVRVLVRIWQAAGYPWSVRLKALLPQWLPWARKHIAGLSPQVETELLAMSPRQMDRRLADKRRRLKRRLYGRTKPGSLLKQQIPIKTDHWDVDEPGYCEIDLVSHSGPHAAGEFIYSLNLTDIFTGWGESFAIMGKGERGVVDALDTIRRTLPFALKAIDSDNGSEFINHHLHRYCKRHGIQFTRGRPYKKDDNAHIEQKNWTHVRKLLGWERYDTHGQLDTINQLYRGDWRTMMNFYQPCVKLKEKVRIASRLIRRYDQAQTPLDRVVAHYGCKPLPAAVCAALALRDQTDPFELAVSIDRHLVRLARPVSSKEAQENCVLEQFIPSPRGGDERTLKPRPTSHAW